MNDSLNPHAMPFRPAGSDRRFPPMPPPALPPPFMPHMMHGGPWPDFPPPPPPPPPPHFFAGNPNGFNNHAPPIHHNPHPHQPPPHLQQQHSHAFPHAQTPPPNRGPWPQRPHDFHSQQPPYGMPPHAPMPHDNGHRFQRGPQQFPPPGFPHFQHQGPPPFQHPAHFSTMTQGRMPPGATPEELERPAPPAKKSKKAKAKAKAQAQAAADELDIQNNHRATPAPKKGRYGQEKIMLPAPQPLDAYLAQASGEPSPADAPQDLLVILDLNGTVLYRPNKNPQTMIARPYLTPFMRYLFQNFKVMVWSSAQPANVKALVDQALTKDLRSKLVASWARDTFGLSAANYSKNVQVYKNLRLVWSRDQIQQHHPKYHAGERFGQHNTVLIDDSVLKANAQPYNLLEIPEFEATPEQMEGDVLCELAGYLEVLRQQADVSKFVKREPFQSGGTWKYEWPAEPVNNGESKSKSSKGKNRRPSPANPVSQITDAFSAANLGVPHSKEL